MADEECGETLRGRALGVHCINQRGHDGKHFAPVKSPDGGIMVLEWYVIEADRRQTALGKLYELEGQ